MNYKLLRKMVAPIVKFLWPIEIINKGEFVEKKGVYICNHYSIFDVNHFGTQLFTNGLNALVKEEALRNPLLKWIVLGVGGIPIKRGEADMRAMKAAMNVLRNDGSLIIFPEGTRNKEGTKEMLPFKDGPAVLAIKNKTNIYPMMYYRPIKLFRKTYLIIGKEIDLSTYYNQQINDIRKEVSDLLRTRMEELRYELDSIVENKERLRAVRKTEKHRVKEAKKANRNARKLSRKAKIGTLKAKVDK